MSNTLKVTTQESSHIVGINTSGSSNVIKVKVATKENIVSPSDSGSHLISVSTSQRSPVSVGVITNQATVYVPTGDDGEVYNGRYDVRPSITNDVTLETKGKTLMNNVTVRKIRRYEVTNDTGGKTVYIGWEE